MLRPAITVFTAGHPAIPAPIDAVDPFAWLVGYALSEDHRRDPQLGQCTACGDTATQCGAHRAGLTLMRASLAPTDRLERAS